MNCRKNFLTITLLVSSLQFSSVFCGTVSTPIELPTVTDPILANVSNCLTSVYGPLVAGAIGQFNTYVSPLLAVNPKDPSNILAVMGRDSATNASPLYTSLGFDSVLAVSTNCGESWTPSIAQPTQCLGGTLAPEASYLDIGFSPSGTAYFLGVYNQTSPYDINAAQGGIFAQYSKDGGLTWSSPVILQTASSAIFSVPAPNCATAPTPCFAENGIGFLLADPTNCHLVHANWCNLDTTFFEFGGVWYARSTDAGKSFGTPVEIYDLSTDQVFINSCCHNPNFNQPYFAGQCYAGSIVSVPHKKCEVLISGILRQYPRNYNASGDPVTLTTTTNPWQTNWTQTPIDTIDDHAVVRSFDKGETWSSEPVLLPQYLLSISHDPRTTGSSIILVPDNVLGFMLAVSPKTNRVYGVWQGGVLTNDLNQNAINSNYPEIQLSVSDDAGASWSHNVRVSKTQDILPQNAPGNQSFNANIAILPDGYVGIIYTDYRNYVVTTPTGPVATDVWLAIYKETKSCRGGSTGVGLDFVEELRLTTTSFDASIAFASPVGPASIGASTGIATKGNKFLTAWGQTNQGSQPTYVDPATGATIDVNNRENIWFAKARV